MNSSVQVTCAHPDKQHYAHGMCQTCYNRARYHTNPADRAARRERNLRSYHEKRTRAERLELSRRERSEARRRQRQKILLERPYLDDVPMTKVEKAMEKKRAKENEDSKPLTKTWWKDGFVLPPHWLTEASRDPGKIGRPRERECTFDEYKMNLLGHEAKMKAERLYGHNEHE